MRVRRQDCQSGFTLLELVIVMSLAIAVAAVAVPSFNSLIASQRARTAARAVERELQTARLKAVTSSRPMQVRLNCPVAGQVRLVERTGVASTDQAANRCDPVAFPTPGPSDMLRSTPSHDGAVVYLPTGTTVSSAVTIFEFDSRGEVSQVDGAGNATALTQDVVVNVTRAGWSSDITINVRGRIKIS